MVPNGVEEAVGNDDVSSGKPLNSIPSTGLMLTRTGEDLPNDRLEVVGTGADTHTSSGSLFSSVTMLWVVVCQ